MDVTEVIFYASTDGRERVGLVAPAQAYVWLNGLNADVTRWRFESLEKSCHLLPSGLAREQRLVEPDRTCRRLD